MAPDWKYINHPADRSLKEDLSIDTTFDPSYISWDTPFNLLNAERRDAEWPNAER